MMYRLTTGWYPSRNTAEKVLKKVKSFIPKARLVNNDEVFFSVECGLYTDAKEADSAKKDFLSHGVYCGIECIL